jgi:antirestriction protein ArdC
MKRDVYQDVTDRIVKSLENGVAPWVKPWKSDGRSAGVHRNALTRRPYHGINVCLLTLEQMCKGYESGEWVTYRQAKELGGHVRKGEKATPIVLWKKYEKNATDEQGRPLFNEDGERVKKTLLFARMFSVFNVEQCDGLTAEQPTERPKGFVGYEGIDAAIANIGATIDHGGDRAYYSPSADRIRLPRPAQFADAASYYATAAHELTHWTGHASRLARDLSGRFGDESYAAEELIAEMGAAFTCATLGIAGHLQHAEYIGSWIKVLKNDKRAIFTAASKAQEAADFLLARALREEVREAA